MRSDDYPKAKSGATTAASQSGATSETAAAGRRGGATCAICCATTGTGFVTTGGTVGAHILGAARTALGLCDATHTDTLSFGTGALGKLDVLGGMLPPGTVPLQVVSHTPSQVQGVLQQGLQTLTGCMYPPQAAPVPPPPEPPPPQTEAECDPPGVYDYAPDPDPVEHVPCAKLAPRTVNAPIIVPPPNRKRKMHDADADAEDDGGPGPVGADSESSYEWVEVDDDDEPEWTGGRRPQQPPWAPPLHMKLRQNVQRQLKRLKPHSWQKPGFEFKD